MVPLVHELLEEALVLLGLLAQRAYIGDAQIVALSHLPQELVLYEYLMDYVNLLWNS